jgi:hypothetical protein
LLTVIADGTFWRNLGQRRRWHEIRHIHTVRLELFTQRFIFCNHMSKMLFHFSYFFDMRLLNTLNLFCFSSNAPQPGSRSRLQYEHGPELPSPPLLKILDVSAQEDTSGARL